MFLGFNRGIEVQRPEMWWRGTEHQVHVAGEDLFVSVESRKAMVIGNLLLPLLGKIGAAFVEMVWEEVPQCHDFEVGSRLEEVQGGAGAPLTAADQASLQDRAIRRYI